jgi:hypothetical protein
MGVSAGLLRCPGRRPPERIAAAAKDTGALARRPPDRPPQ